MKLLLRGLVCLLMDTRVNKADAFDVRLRHTNCSIRACTEILADFHPKFVTVAYPSHASLPGLDFHVS